MIVCTEKCIYQQEGLCGLKKITNFSSKPIKYCPYFKVNIKYQGRIF